MNMQLIENIGQEATVDQFKVSSLHLSVQTGEIRIRFTT
jgi:hypothetical protein